MIILFNHWFVRDFLLPILLLTGVAIASGNLALLITRG